MKRFLTKHGMIVLTVATTVAVMLSLVSFFSSNTTLFTNIVNTISAPFRSAGAAVTGWVEDLISYTRDFDALKEENQALKEQIADMEEQIRQAEKDSQENQLLREALELRQQRRDLTLASGKITQHNASNWESTFTLDIGEDCDVTQGDCVITSTGELVGLITEVGANWATCATVLDTETSIGARIVRTGDVGVAEGNFSLMEDGLLRLSYLSADATPSNGDLVVTSGLGGYYPSDLEIGSIREVMTGEDGLAQYAVLVPSANLETLRQVFVITDFTIVD